MSSGLERKAVCVIPLQEDVLSYESRTQMVERAKAMAEELKQKLGLEIKVGLGSVRPWESMYESYQEALNALRHGKWTITHIDDLTVEDAGPQTEGDLEHGLVKAVMSGLEHEARREATVFTGWLMKHQELGLEAKKLRLMEVYLLVRRRVQEQKGGEADDGEELKKLRLLTEEEALCRQFIHAVKELARSVVIRQPQADSVIVKAQAYIRANFSRDLPLEEVACQAGISPYYFSRMFKEETGTNYSEYLTEVRIETAKQLLMNPAINIKQVCLRSGYTNPNYFSRIFKKCTGITPTEFRGQWLAGNGG